MSAALLAEVEQLRADLATAQGLLARVIGSPDNECALRSLDALLGSREAELTRRTVYVLCFGERCEGHSPEAVYATLDAAKAAAEKTGTFRGRWQEYEATKAWKAEVSGVDECWIYAMPVQGAAVSP